MCQFSAEQAGDRRRAPAPEPNRASRQSRRTTSVAAATGKKIAFVHFAHRPSTPSSARRPGAAGQQRHEPADGTSRLDSTSGAKL